MNIIRAKTWKATLDLAGVEYDKILVRRGYAMKDGKINAILVAKKTTTYVNDQDLTATRYISRHPLSGAPAGGRGQQIDIVKSDNWKEFVPGGAAIPRTGYRYMGTYTMTEQYVEGDEVITVFEK